LGQALNGHQGERAKGKAGIIFGNKGGQDPKAGPKTRKNQQKYIVVRFGLLSPLVNSQLVPQMCFINGEPEQAKFGFYGISLESNDLFNFDLF